MGDISFDYTQLPRMGHIYLFAKNDTIEIVHNTGRVSPQGRNLSRNGWQNIVSPSGCRCMLAEGKVIWDVAVWIRPLGILELPMKQESPV
ncbi:hypothetical protein CV014_00865 [Nostoc sp. CMAA1605]|nr:hypothetical protein [Nostoc sp. CMAA1605]